MSSVAIQGRISSVQHRIESLQRQLTQRSREEASKSQQIADLSRSMARCTSASTVESKQRQAQRLQNDVVRLQRDKADLTKRIAEETAKLHKHQEALYKEQGREQQEFQKSLERREREERRRQRSLLKQLTPNAMQDPESEASRQLERPMEHDAFISHASEDKVDVVRPLATSLLRHGLNIWYDEFELAVGDSLRRSIDKGLRNSRFGIVVLSPSFFEKNWPQYELDGLAAKEMNGGKVILPLWHKVSKDEVMGYSPTLADRVALSTATYSVDDLAAELAKAMI